MRMVHAGRLAQRIQGVGSDVLRPRRTRVVWRQSMRIQQPRHPESPDMGVRPGPGIKRSDARGGRGALLGLNPVAVILPGRRSRPRHLRAPRPVRIQSRGWVGCRVERRCRLAAGRRLPQPACPTSSSEAAVRRGRVRVRSRRRSGELPGRWQHCVRAGARRRRPQLVPGPLRHRFRLCVDPQRGRPACAVAQPRRGLVVERQTAITQRILAYSP